MINAAQLKCFALFPLFALIDFGPVSPWCLMGLYIVLMRPEWFLHLVKRIYSHPRHSAFITTKQTRIARVTSFLALLGLLIIDIAPLPVSSLLALAILLVKPKWFYRTVIDIYGEIV